MQTYQWNKDGMRHKASWIWKEKIFVLEWLFQCRFNFLATLCQFAFLLAFASIEI